jgi:hypothetical protein
MIYDDEPRRRRHYPIWSGDRAASGSPGSQGKSTRKPSLVISRPQRDLIVGLARQHPRWTAQDIHHWIRYQLGRNDISLTVVKRVLTR